MNRGSGVNTAIMFYSHNWGLIIVSRDTKLMWSLLTPHFLCCFRPALDYSGTQEIATSIDLSIVRSGLPQSCGIIIKSMDL